MGAVRIRNAAVSLDKPYWSVSVRTWKAWLVREKVEKRRAKVQVFRAIIEEENKCEP